jgi:pimeloyl-ACP methyl ester carboxylesterase
VVGALVLLVACSGDDGGTADPQPTTTTATTSAPTPPGPVEVEDVYAVPDPLPAGEPGDVIQFEAMGAVPDVEGATAWRVLYHSRSLQGDDIAVSGVIVRPAGDPPPGGFPVVSWAHGTTGTADVCAPSTARSPFVPSLPALLDAGYAVAATDYEGLGTPGLHPYLVGESEGRGVLDAARAASRLDGVDASSDVVLWGHSQGGHAALFAGEIAADYAPELDVHGVIAMAPAGDLAVIGPAALRVAPLFPFGFMAVGTWPEAYPDLDLTEVFTPAALEQLPMLDAECTEGVFDAFADRSIEELVLPTARIDAGPLYDLFTANTVGARPYGDVPVLVVHGSDDSLVPIGLSEALVPALCAGGARAELRAYPATHGSIPTESASDGLAWTADRFARAPLTTGC